MFAFFKKIFSLPGLFVEKLINPSPKQVKHFLEDDDLESRFLNKQITKLKTTQKTDLKIVTHKSVFLKFTALLLVWLISLLFIFIYYRNPANLDTLVQTVINIANKFNFHQMTGYLDNSFIRLQYAPFFPLLLSIFIFIVIGVLWTISFYCWISLLKIMNYFAAISVGLLLGSFYLIFDTPILLFLLFVIPLSVTVLVLGLITYLHQIKKKFKITDQVKQKFVILFTLFFFFGIFIQVFLFLGNKFFDFSNKVVILMLVISLLLYILEFVLAAFIWAIALEKLDQFVEQKLPKKYESLLVSIMFGSFMAMFFAILEIMLFILELIGFIAKNQKK